MREQAANLTAVVGPFKLSITAMPVRPVARKIAAAKPAAPAASSAANRRPATKLPAKMPLKRIASESPDGGGDWEQF
jgi:hypothetical protein